jgi:hypothetical protein
MEAHLTRRIAGRLRRVVKTYDDYQYHRHFREQALKAVDVVERFNGVRLHAADRRRADEYAREVLGSPVYAPWLYLYAVVSGTFQPGWIPDNYFGLVVMPAVNSSLRTIASFKTFSHVVLSTEALPDIAYYIGGLLYGRDMTVITPGELRDELGAGQHATVYLKKDHGGRGEGVSRIAVQDLTSEALAAMGDCVVQTPIRQHPFFSRIITGSVATVRITTVKEPDGRIAMRAAYLRLGRQDTAWVQSNRSVRVAIVDQAGRLDDRGYTEDWRLWNRHPDTGAPFMGQCIPHFSDAVAACTALHQAVPQLTIIGWDVTIGEDDQVKLIEYNAGHCDIKFSEATTGPCFLGLSWERLRPT